MMKNTPSRVVGIDLGNNSFKVVCLRKRGNQYVLAGAAMVPNQHDPLQQTLQTEENVASQIKALVSLITISSADVHYSINSPNSTIRYVDLPKIPLQEIRSALKLNSATYLRQNFENYTFDACPLDREAAAVLASSKLKFKQESTPSLPGKIRILVGGIFTPEIVLYFHASRRAGIKPKSLQLAPISLINGFEAAYPEIFHAEAVVLLDMGFLSSSLTILDKGVPLLTRTVPVGGKQITECIAQISNLNFTKAEAAKLQGDPNLDDAVARTVVTLIREVRSSINFFEKNSDRSISKIYLTGASAYAPAVVKTLTRDIGTTCEPWNSARGLTLELPSKQQDIFNQNPFAFSTALGVARTYTIITTNVKPLETSPTTNASAKSSIATLSTPHS